ncbi:uncharacterized protein LOC127287040 [Leptopilina boulardi]|uniref:uncharacterized protein LOC127287040 n=1 Tax=Leptopilina boulardi TaxID=63433 RepID=UPI0021F675C2|nr:uncharacterized protein LOC127287040 [Leptopilina boulardi]
MSEENVQAKHKCGYCGYFIKDMNDVLNHSCFDNYNETNEFINIDDNHIVTIICQDVGSGNRVKGKNLAWNDEWDESLIAAVWQRPALHNYLLPVKERSPLKLNDLWNEIHNTLGVSTVSILKSRWKYLLGQYRKEKLKRNEYIPSGSAATKKKKKGENDDFQLFEMMTCFDVSKPMRTLHTFSSDSDSENENEKKTEHKIKKKKNKRKENSNSAWSTEFYGNLLTSLTPNEKIDESPLYSLLPTFKQLQKQRQVRVGKLFQQILQEELEGQLREN